jgi:tellurite resistance protein TerC
VQRQSRKAAASETFATLAKVRPELPIRRFPDPIRTRDRPASGAGLNPAPFDTRRTTDMQTIANPWLWGGFIAVVIAALLADLVLMRHGGPHKVTFKEALWWSAGWVALALAFNAGLWWYLREAVDVVTANRVGLEFLTGYLVEKSLAVDNIFVFLMVMTYFAVPEEQRQRVLVLGVLGAIALRAIMIFAGAALLARFHWLLYVFGAFLLLTGIKMWFSAGQEPDLEANPVLRWMRYLRISRTTTATG